MSHMYTIGAPVYPVSMANNVTSTVTVEHKPLLLWFLNF